jgi:hypothetical protein
MALIGRFAWVLPVALATAASAATLRVPEDFSTIQAAIDAAGPGDHIQVALDVYGENLVIDGKTLFIDGAISGIGLARVTASHVRSPEAALTIVHGAEVQITRMRFAGAGTDTVPMDQALAGGVGIRCENSTATLLSCEVFGGEGSDGNGSFLNLNGRAGASAMFSSGESAVTLHNCQLTGGIGGNGLPDVFSGGGTGGAGGAGLDARTGSFVRIADTELIGGKAGVPGFALEGSASGAAGGAAISALGPCSLLLKRSALTGGAGTSGIGPFGPGGDGGDGVFGRLGVRVGQADNTFVAGHGGGGTPSGDDGRMFDFDSLSTLFTNPPAIAGFLIGGRLVGPALVGADTNADGVIDVSDVVRALLVNDL